MKHLLAIIFLLIPTFTLALPCPNGTHIIYKGNSLEEVIAQCGQPMQQNNYSRNIAVSQKWEYYKPAPNQTNIKITILFDHNQVVNINTVESNTTTPQLCQSVIQNGVAIQTNCSNTRELNVASTAICGSIIQKGDSTNAVLAACGRPSTEQVLQSYPVQYTELSYAGTATTPSQTLVFEDSKLIDFK